MKLFLAPLLIFLATQCTSMDPAIEDFSSDDDTGKINSSSSESNNELSNNNSSSEDLESADGESSTDQISESSSIKNPSPNKESSSSLIEDVDSSETYSSSKESTPSSDTNDSSENSSSSAKDIIVPSNDIEAKFAPYTKITGDKNSELHGAELEGASIGFFDEGDWILFSGVDFGESSRSVTLDVAGSNSGGVMDLRVGSTTGDILSSFTMTSTGDWSNWEDYTIGITEITGVHDLYLVGNSGGTGILNISSIQFSAEVGPTKPKDPSNLSLTVDSDNAISASWDDNSDNEIEYTLYWTRGSTKPTAASATIGANSTSHSITGLTSGSEYHVWVCAVNGVLTSECISKTTTTTGPPPAGVDIKVVSLNVYGWATMPGASPQYAQHVFDQDADVVGLQEGVHDWKIGPGMPTNYGNADAMGAALGSCWEQRYQIYVNTCKGNQFVSSRRFDMTDGPNATRTGESAIISKNGVEYGMITVHWDHESHTTKMANGKETADEVNSYPSMPFVVVGDFNSGCTDAPAQQLASTAGMTMIVNSGIDCIWSKDFPGSGGTFNASPSDHPGASASLSSQ